MNIDELERLSEAATDGPSAHFSDGDIDIGELKYTASFDRVEDAAFAAFVFTHRKTILRMLRAGEKMATTIEGELHSPKCHLNSSRPFGSKLREEWDAKGCDCWKSVLKEYQTAKESI